MNTLRKRPTYDNLVYYLNHQPTIQYPARKGIRAINDPIISNLLFDDDFMDDKKLEQWEEVMISDKATQTPHVKGTQTNFTDEKGVQTPDFRPKLDYEVNPEKYRKIDATSQRKSHHFNTYWFYQNKQKNDATSETIQTGDDELKDNVNQTAIRYIPGSLKKKSDNINQTVRFELLSIQSPIPTPDPTPMPSANPTPTPTEVELPEIPTHDSPDPPWWYGLFFGPDDEVPIAYPDPPSGPPSVPSASVRSPSTIPSSSEDEGGYPPYPPFSPSPVAYPASEEEAEEEDQEQENTNSSKSSKGKK